MQQWTDIACVHTNTSIMCVLQWNFAYMQFYQSDATINLQNIMKLIYFL